MYNFRERRVHLNKASPVGFVQNGHCILWTFWGYHDTNRFLSALRRLVVTILYILQSLVTTFWMRGILFIAKYRVTHKGCDFSDDPKLLKSSKFISVSFFTFCLTLVDIYKNYWEQKILSVTCCNPQSLLKQDWINYLQSSLKSHSLWVTL